MSLNDQHNLWDVFKKESKKEEVNNDVCFSCKSMNIERTDKEVICKDCGVINNNIIDHNAEWRWYSHDDSKSVDPTRCGMPTNELLPQSSWGSTISFSYGESFDMKKVRTKHSWQAMPYKERSLYNVFMDIQHTAIDNGITQVIIEEAKVLYKHISETKISRGSNRKGIIAACIYKACKLKGVPRSHKEIATIFGINIKHMTRGCKKFDEIMNTVKNTDSVNMVGSNSLDYINRFCSKLKLTPELSDICKHVCRKAEESCLVSENTPPSIAAGSIYLICNLLNINISKYDISEICKISEVTISKCYKTLLTKHAQLLPDNIISRK
jgi:transcription initiation factor TFIIB